MDGGAGKAAVHGITKRRTLLSNFTFTFHFPALEKEMATHSSVLAWRIPGTGEPGGPLSMGSHRVGHDWSDLAAAASSFWSGWLIPGGSDDKSVCLQCGRPGFNPWVWKIPWRNGNPLQYCCLENPMDGGAWWVTVHGIAKSWTRLSNFTFFLSLKWVIISLWQFSKPLMIVCLEKNRYAHTSFHFRNDSR